ncbi:hypothetical protein D3218_16615 [Aureimonas flava]|uniref:Cell division protein FtsL n=1 Tax=Aureimonas flava TaxID=2320271 RepID=A0A3A1WIZ8_9HYPH|nr:hypothetical protein [Aureimonas flava]RIX98803.1 hypothetical protein D3218_16615 [Aureimonas flava]
MLKTLDVLLVAIVLVAATWTFGQKYHAEALEHQVMLLDRKITQEHETMQLLEADWSLLNQPFRLEALARNFDSVLELRPVEPQQIVDPNQLPAVPVPQEAAHEAKIASASQGRIR